MNYRLGGSSCQPANTARKGDNLSQAKPALCRTKSNVEKKESVPDGIEHADIRGWRFRLLQTAVKDGGPHEELDQVSSPL